MSGKTRGYAHDVDAWVQFHLLRLASFHPETTKADLAVLAEIIQRYWGKYGNGWVTHEMLGVAAGVSKATVIRAKRTLERLGFITVLQAGRRGSATVYLPNFGLVPAKGSKDDTQTLGSMGATETMAIGVGGATETPENGVTDATPSYLRDRPTRAESLIDRDACATPSASLADGLAATAARTAQGDGFERLWKAYSHRQRKSDAREAFDELAPDTDLLEQMVTSAAAWQAAWAAQGRPDAPRKSLYGWLRGEFYDCDPPKAYAPPKPSSALPRAGYLAPTPAEIINADVAGERRTVSLVVQPAGGQQHIEYSFDLVKPDGASSEDGAGVLRSVMEAVGLPQAGDTSELLNRPFLLSRIGGRYKFDAVPANDNAAVLASTPAVDIRP